MCSCGSTRSTPTRTVTRAASASQGCDPDARLAAIRRLAGNSPAGRHALDVLDRNHVNVRFARGEGYFYDPSTNTMTLDEDHSDLRSVMDLAHEMNHAEAHHTGASANIDTMRRQQYIDTALNEEAHGTVLSIQARDELAASGQDVSHDNFPLQDEYHQSYNQAVQAERTRNPSASAADLDRVGRAAGERRVLDGFRNGEVTTSNTGQSYSDYYGNAWDGAHPGGH